MSMKNEEESNLHSSTPHSGENYSPNYLELRSHYQHKAQIEVTMQIISLIFVIVSFLIELVIFNNLMRIYIQLDHRFFQIFQRFGRFFVILFVISFLALAQFIIVQKWNQRIKRKSLSLSSVNSDLIEHIKVLRLLIFFIILLCIFYIRRISNIDLPDAMNTPRFIDFYRQMLIFSWILALGYMLFEIYQLIKWSRRLNLFRKGTQKIMNEISGFKELTDILKENDELNE